MIAPTINIQLRDPFFPSTIDRNAFYRYWIATIGEGTLYGAGDMTVCKLPEDEAGVELLVPGERIASWNIPHPDEELEHRRMLLATCWKVARSSATHSRRFQQR